MGKLTDKQKERIKYLYNEQGYKVTLLADMFGVDRSSIYYIIDDKYKEKSKERSKKRIRSYTEEQKEHKRAYNRERYQKLKENGKLKESQKKQKEHKRSISFRLNEQIYAVFQNQSAEKEIGRTEILTAAIFAFLQGEATTITKSGKQIRFTYEESQ